MKGLAVVDGDLVLSGNSYLTVDGPAKIKQDLTFALNDPYGADMFHPYWGSILDMLIGQPSAAVTQKQVIDEVARVLNNYISVQGDQVNRAVVAGVASGFDTADVVQTVRAIDAQISMDSIKITLTLTTMAGDTVTVSRTVA